MADVVVSLDMFGRILIPMEIRKKLTSKRFAMQVENEEITLKPLKSWDELFGIMHGISTKDLKKMRREDAENERFT